MTLRARFLLTLAFIVVIFLADIVANKLYLYWTFVALDKWMHFVGGLAAGLVIMAGFELFKQTRIRWGAATLGAFIVGIIWEIVEFKLHISHYGPEFMSDTVTDLIADIIGGLTSYFLWIQLPQKKQQ